MKFYLEVVQSFDSTYYANMTMGGNDSDGKYHKPELVKGLPEYVSYNELREAIRRKTGVEIPLRKQLVFQRFGRKRYAYVDATQPLPNGCIVTLDQVIAGHRPCFAEK